MQTADCQLRIETVHYCLVQTSLGWMGLAGRDGKLVSCFMPRRSRAEAAEALKAGLNESTVEDVRAFGELPGKLRNYFEGKRVDFTSEPIDLKGQPDFFKKCLLACRELPYGTVVSYGDLAREIGAPNASRAVGNAMARNPMPIIIPCHRVVASNGKLGGFSAGIDWKIRLLRLERVNLQC